MSNPEEKLTVDVPEVVVEVSDSNKVQTPSDLTESNQTLSNDELLASLLKIILNNNSTPVVEIDEDTQKIILKLLEVSPNIFSSITLCLQKIIKDGKIDSKDVPVLILLVQELYQMIYSVKDLKMTKTEIAEFCGKLLKFCVNQLIEEKIIDITKGELDQLVDSCVLLLTLLKQLKTPSCLSNITKLFNK